MKWKRIFTDFLLVLILAVTFQLIYYALLMFFDNDHFWLDLKAWPIWILVDFVWCFVCSVVFAQYYIWRRNHLEQERDKYRMQALETHLAPHFVFNNFSTLAGMIEEDPEQASDYLMKLSKVYRFILSHIDHNTVTLQEELAFLRSGLELMSSRYGEVVQVRIADNVKGLEGSLPPAALQMLVENAVKHNEHTEAHPLIIEVTGDEHHLCVTNNRQPIAPIESAKMGQHNLIERYRLLTHRKVVINETEDSYSVTIPLIAS